MTTRAPVRHGRRYERALATFRADQDGAALQAMVEQTKRKSAWVTLHGVNRAKFKLHQLARRRLAGPSQNAQTDGADDDDDAVPLAPMLTKSKTTGSSYP